LSEQSESERFREIALPHLNAAYNLARWLTRNDHDAEDVVQEAYMRAHRFFAGFHGTNGRAWLLAIVRNTAYTWLHANRNAGLSTSFDEEFHGQDDAPGAQWFDALDTGPEAALMRSDVRQLVNRALQSLPTEFREVLVLRELEDLSYKEISLVAEIPVGTVMSRLARGRKLLAERLKDLKLEPCDGLQTG
jgi:RNA polymerase sigma-70 factor (ECF subfamily)